MFGLKHMYRERERLYQRALRLEEKAGDQRIAVKSQVLSTLASAQGVLVSFGLGMTTQCDAATKARNKLFKSAQSELIGIISQYFVSKVQPQPSANDSSSQARKGESTSAN